MTNIYPKLHNAMWPGIVGKGAPDSEPIIPLDLFHSRVFDVAVGMGFTVGMAMFGAIIFIPLYLQVVYGASATSSGLRFLRSLGA